MKFLCLIPFGTAVAARLMYQRWQAWASWGVGAFISFLVLWIGPLSLRWAAGAVAIASGIGFAAPELWEAFRGLMRRPRAIAVLLGIGGIVYLAFHPEVLATMIATGWQVGVLLLVLVGLGFMVVRAWRR